MANLSRPSAKSRRKINAKFYMVFHFERFVWEERMKSTIANSMKKCIVNESGYTLVSCLSLISFLVMGFSVILNRTHQQFERITLSRAQVDARFLQKNITMIFANRSVCQSNISDSAIGRTLNNVARPQTQLFFPNTSGSHAGYRLAVGSKWKNMEINSLRFTAVNRVTTSDLSYIATLNIGIRVGMTNQILNVPVPFYFLTDSSGNLQDCFATQMLPPSPGQPALALEDALCKQIGGGPQYSYRPFEHICFNMSSQPTTSVLLTGIDTPNNRLW